MALLTVLLVLGSVARLIVLVLRPSAAERFRQPRRQVLATRLEQAGDVGVIVAAVTMVLFGYGHRPGAGLLLIWTVVLLVGFGCVLGAHAVARNHRPTDRPARA